MKKIVVLLLALMFLLTGCASLTESLEGVVQGALGGGSTDTAPGSAGTATPESKTDDDVIYSEIDSYIGNPNRSSSKLPETFTFVAMILGDGEEFTFDEEETAGFYYPACISRSDYDEYFYLEASAATETFAFGDIVKVTGSLNGSIYWTEDNKQVDILDIMADSVVSYTPEEIETNTDFIYEINGNEIEFLGAHYTEDSFNDVVVVYFDFTNKGSDSATPTLSPFYVEYNNEEVSKTIFSLDEIHSSALEYSGYGTTQDTYAGKTNFYYAAYSVGTKAEGDQGIYFDIYDDEFRLTHSIGLFVYDDLADLMAEPDDGLVDA